MGSQTLHSGYTVTAQEQITETERVVSSYRPSSYAEATWPTIEVPSTEASKAFAPTQFERISESSFAVDPMFADFGAEAVAQSTTRQSAPSSIVETHTETPSESEMIEEALESPKSDSESAPDPIEDEEREESHGQEEADVKAEDSATSTQDVDGATAVDSVALEAALIQARQEGYAQGCSETRADVHLHQQQLEERYTLLWEDMQTQLTETVRAHEQQAIELAFQIARRMVGAVVDSQREYVVSVVKEALHAAGSSEVKVVRVSPQDFEFLQLGGYGERIKIHGDKKLVFESDETIRSGCIVLTNAGEIDFDLDKAWTRMHEKTLQGPRS